MRNAALLNGALIALLASAVLAFAGGASVAEGRRDATSSQLIFVRYADTPGPCLACDQSLFVVGSDGSGLRTLIDEGENPAWSPDGAKIAYVSNGYEISPEGIFVVNADGRRKQRIVPGYFGSPRWSPDGTRLVFGGRRGLGIVNLKSGTRRWLALPRGLGAGDPDWSPDGRQIAFSGGFAPYPAPTSIFVVNVDGSGLRKVTHLPRKASDNSVRWSPDGKRLLFYREGLDIRDARGRWVQLVYTANAKTGTLKLVYRGIHVLSVSWSPDGRQFAYAGGPVGNRIHIFDLARRRDRTLNLKPCAGEGSCHFVDW